MPNESQTWLLRTHTLRKLKKITVKFGFTKVSIKIPSRFFCRYKEDYSEV